MSRFKPQTTDELKQLKLQTEELVRDYIDLVRFRQDMIEQQPFKAGDRVALTDQVLNIDYDKSYGWRGWQSIIQPGNTGTVVNVDWNSVWKYWSAGFTFDIDWHSQTFSGRHKSKHVWISRRSSLFYMPYEYLRPIAESDRPILPPTDGDVYEWTDLPDPPPYTKRTSWTEVVQHFRDKYREVIQL